MFMILGEVITRGRDTTSYVPASLPGLGLQEFPAFLHPSNPTCHEGLGRARGKQQMATSIHLRPDIEQQVQAQNPEISYCRC